MTELTSSVEVILSSDLFSDDLCLESMSAPALAVLDAYMAGYGWLDSPTKKDCLGLAAALQAAADQVVPAENPPADFLDTHVAAEIDQRRSTRSRLLAIAAELKGANG